MSYVVTIAIWMVMATLLFLRVPAMQSATAASGFGLRLMEYRARVIGGTFEVAPIASVSARLERRLHISK